MPKLSHRIFLIAMFLKTVKAVLEVVGALLLVTVPSALVYSFVSFLVSWELSEDPQDIFANRLLHFTRDITGSSEVFFSFYLVSHGILNLFLVYALMKRIAWAYPVAIAAFTLLVTYEIYRYALHASSWLLFAAFLDAVMIVTTIIEYRSLLKTPRHFSV